jgi:alpha/beta superfamily hydrolase
MATPFRELPFVLKTKQAQLAAVLHSAKRGALVILCHGFTGTKSESGRLFVTTARALQRAGLNALRFDFMGSGDSSGNFREMTPNTQIRDALDVLAWGRRRYRRVAFLGLSFGGATVICASHQAAKKPDALLTWSSVPSLRWWRATRPEIENVAPGDPFSNGPRFFRDRPKVDVPEAYVALKIPRLQIQGDRDIAEFRERFAAFCPKDDPLVRHLVLPGADHVFNRWPDRRRVITESVRWLKRHLA